MHHGAKQELDRTITSLEQRLERLRALRAAMDDDEIVAEMTKAFAVNGSAQSVQRSGGNMTKIRQFFENRGNQWATIAQIVDAIGISKHSLRQLLYRSNKEEFERESHRGGGQESLFRLLAETEEGTNA